MNELDSLEAHGRASEDVATGRRVLSLRSFVVQFRTLCSTVTSSPPRSQKATSRRRFQPPMSTSEPASLFLIVQLQRLGTGFASGEEAKPVPERAASAFLHILNINDFV
ncbi:hypothetical protein [Bacillus songklensis]|uniref:hypothetical protein n=1 Tax=Bacillus songklensis TaxID=1069116 RepID=UPI00366C71E4